MAIGWALAIATPTLLILGIVADSRAQASHDRLMAAMRERAS